jgi:serine/threonine protein kinase
MSHSESEHPSPAQLEQFTLGQVEPAEAAELESHLAECPTCCNTLAQFETSMDGFVSQLRSVYTAQQPGTDTPPAVGQTSGVVPTNQHRTGPTGGPDPFGTVLGVHKEAAMPVTEPVISIGPTAKATSQSFGEYDQLELIAQGGMGVVYRARQQSLNRTVALKMIRSDLLGTEEAVQRFYHEARAAAALDHPNIVPIFEINQVAGCHYFTMAYVPGKRLRDVVSKGKPLGPRAAVELLLPIVDAVAYAHERGIIHRDLKPDNILIDQQGRPRVTDFGLAKQLEGNAHLTATGAVLGTPSYMAPEQALGEPTGPGTDVYALGGILYFLLTSRPPFVASTATQVLSKLLAERPAPPRQLNAAVPAALSAICERCLAKKPDARYTSAPALKEALTEFLRTAPAVDTMPAVPRDLTTRYVLGIAACAFLAIGIGWWLAAHNSATPPESAPGTPTVVAKEGNEVPARPAKFELPNIDHNDFALQVEMAGGKPGKDDIAQINEDDKISLTITPARDAYVSIFCVEADGAVTRLFPNEHETGQFKAGVARVVPNPALEKKYTITTTPSAGVDCVRVIATTEPLATPEGTRAGVFRVFDDAASREGLATALRGVRGLKINNARLAAQVDLRFKVLPAKK